MHHHRFFSALAIVVASCVPAVSVGTSVATAGEFLVREPLAHTMETQTQGPAGASSPNNPIPWGLDRIDQRALPKSGTYTYTTGSDGTGVTVYVLDSGVDGAHPDFTGRVVDGWSYRADATSLYNYKLNLAAWLEDRDAGIPEAQRRGVPPCARTFTVGTQSYAKERDPAVWDAPASVDNSDKGTTDNDGHGTHVAGTAAGTLAGVAKKATIVPVRALDSCGVGTETMVLNAIAWISSNHQPGAKAVVNMSIGFDYVSNQVDAAIQGLISEGVVIVAAAGNSADSACETTPAGTLGTISVGSTTSTDTESYFSNYGECVNIFAPGSEVLSAWPYLEPVGGTPIVHGWRVLQGTSMATPHVTGAVARWLQSQTLNVSSGSEVSDDAWTWLRTGATCGAVVPYRASRTQQTSNRLLAVGAPVTPPCGPETYSAQSGERSGTVSFTPSPSGNGAKVTSYTVTLSPGTSTCIVDPTTAVSPYSCTFTGLDRASRYEVAITATNSAGIGSARQTSFTTAGTPPAVSGVVATAGDHRATITWSGTVVGATYDVTLSPGDATCTTMGTSCTVEGLVNGRTYSVSVVGKNWNGTGTASSGVSVVPDGTPEAPTIAVSSANKSVVVTWSAVDGFDDVSYVVTATPGGRSCTTTTTSCTITGLSNGIAYSFAISVRSATGNVASTTEATAARPGFVVRTTSVKKGSKTRLTSIVTPLSKGTRKWSVRGTGCAIVRTNLVAPRRSSTCTVTLRVAKTTKWPSVATSVKVAVR